MTELGQPILGAIEGEFQEDLSTDRFNQYILLTWSVDEAYLKEFHDDDTVVVCGPDGVGETVEDLERPNISWQHVRSHAKCYLMWGDGELRCWLGSFNLTASGLRDNIEWAVVQEAPLDAALELEVLKKGECEPVEITTDGLLQQVLSIVMGVFTKSEPTLATDYLNTPSGDECVALTNGATPGPSGLHSAVETALARANGEVSLTYYTPFVNQYGIDCLANAIPHHIATEDIDIELRTCRITEVDDQSSYLNRRAIEELNTAYGSFDLLARAYGTAGEELASGEELRSGFAHFKLLMLSYTDQEGDAHTDVVFTSANLTANAWRPGADQLELGLWVRDPSVNELLAEFFGLQLRRCYSTPNDIDLDTIDRLKTVGDLITERSLLELLAERVRIDDQKLTVEWGVTDPPIAELEATILLRDVRGSSPRTESVELTQDEEDSTFSGHIDTHQIEAGWVIHRVQLAVTTRCRPVEYELTNRGREELVMLGSLPATIDSLADELETRGLSYDEFVVNNEFIVRVGDENQPTVGEISTVRVRRYFEGQPRQFRFSVELDEQPHLPTAPLEEVTATAVTTDSLGGFCRVEITSAAELQLEHDMVAFTNMADESVEWLAYAVTETGIHYYFESSVAGDALTATLQAPYAAYYDVDDRQFTVACPPDILPTARQLRSLRSERAYQFTHQPDLSNALPETHPGEAFITPGVPVRIGPPAEIAALADHESVQLAVEWKRCVGAYRAPTITALVNPLVPEIAHSRLVYHGLIITNIEGHPVHFRTPANEFQVNQQVFAADAKPDPKAASDVNLDALNENDHGGWLVYHSTDLLRPSVVLGPDRSIEATVEVSSDAYDTSQQYQVYTDGQLFLIPLFGRHLNGTTIITLRLSINNAPATYGATELVTILHHDRTVTGLRQRVCNANGARLYQQDINHDPEQSLPRLDQYQSQIHSRELMGYLEASNVFRVERRTASELVIEALDPVVLNLGPYLLR